MEKVRTLCFAAGIVMTAWAAGAQPPQQPARDRPQPPPQVGTGAIKGKVVDGQSGAPVARARVRLTGFQGQGAQRPSILTDDSGTFAFTTLPTGNFSIQVDKATFLAGRYPEGGQTLRTGFRPLSLADGQVLDGIAVSLFHGSAIAGRVIDSHGDPLENVEVRAMALPKSGRGRSQMRTSTMTNDIGEFRASRLPAGRYLLMVVPRRFDFNPSESMVADLQPMPTYYPGVLSIEQAQPITVERGTSVMGLDVMALEGVSSVVSGMTIDPSGQPVPGNGSIMARTATDVSGFNGGQVANGPIRPDGTFQIKLPPGDYVLEARGSRPQQQPGDAPFVGSARVSVTGDISGLAIVMGGGARISGRLVFQGANEPPPFPTTNAGQMRVTFGSNDGSLCQAGRATLLPDWTFTVENVTGTCRAQFAGSIPKWTVKAIVHDGKDLLDRPVTFETGQQWKDVEIILTDKRTELTLQVADDQGNATHDYVTLVFSADKTRWDVPGSRYIRPYVPQPISSAAFTGPAGASVALGVIGGAAGGVSGGVTVTGGTFTASSTMVMQAPGGLPARPDTIMGMPPGDYYVVALDDIDGESARDPDTLEQLSRGASRVTLTEGMPIQASVRRVKLASVVGS
jgi:Carboxypeptidase regulatory-like domain